MKEILFKPGPALSGRLEIAVMDFTESGERKRCTITVEYGRPDVLELIDRGMDMDKALEYYQKYIYNQVKFRLLSDWQEVGGLTESMDIIRAHIEPYFDL